MTSAEFSARYHLVKPVADGPVRSLQALSTASGTSVMVHYLVGTPAQNETVRDQIDRLPGPDRGRVLDIVDVEGNVVVVTQLLAGFATLSSWLAGRGAPPRELASIPGHDRPAPAPTPTAGPMAAPTPVPVVPSPVAPRPVTQPLQPAARAPGEFTQLFGSATAGRPTAPAAPAVPPVTAATPPQPALESPPAPAAAPPQAPPPAPPVAVAQPGEFTRLFQSQSGAAPPASNAPSPFSMPVFAPPPPPPPSPEPAPLPFTSGPVNSGRATDVLRSRSAPPAAEPRPIVVPPVTLPPPGVAPLPGSPMTPPPGSSDPAPFFMPLPAVTPIAPMAPLSAPPAPALPTLPPPVLSAPPPAPAHVPSDFTRILGGVSAAPAPHATPPSGAPAAGGAAAPPPAAKSSNLPLIIVLNIVVLAAIALVLYLVLKK